LRGLRGGREKDCTLPKRDDPKRRGLQESGVGEKRIHFTLGKRGGMLLEDDEGPVRERPRGK